MENEPGTKQERRPTNQYGSNREVGFLVRFFLTHGQDGINLLSSSVGKTTAATNGMDTTWTEWSRIIIGQELPKARPRDEIANGVMTTQNMMSCLTKVHTCGGTRWIQSSRTDSPDIVCSMWMKDGLEIFHTQKYQLSVREKNTVISTERTKIMVFQSRRLLGLLPSMVRTNLHVSANQDVPD